MYVSEALARAVYVHFFVGTFGGSCPPPHTKNLATLVTTHTFPLGATGVLVGGGGLGALALQMKLNHG